MVLRKISKEAESIFQSKNSKKPNDVSSNHRYYKWHKYRKVPSEAFDTP